MGLNLQERIKNLDEFRPDINFKDGVFVLKIKFKNGWTIMEPDDPERIAFDVDKNVPNLYWYVSTIEDADLIFDLIETTIAVNKEMEKKLGLYKEKVKELQELFLSSETYDRLLTLQFTFPDDTKKKTKRNPKKVDTAETTKTEDVSKHAYIDPVTGKEYDNTPITSQKPAEGVLIASETVTEIYNEIDDKISKAIGE